MFGPINSRLKGVAVDIISIDYCTVIFVIQTGKRKT